MAPQGTLETIVHGKETLVGNGLLHNVQGTAVQRGRGLVLESNLNCLVLVVRCGLKQVTLPRDIRHTQLKGNDHKGFSGTGRGTSKDGQALVHLLDTEGLTVELAPGVIGGELGSTLGCLHENGSRDTSVESRSTVKDNEPKFRVLFVGSACLPLVAHDLLEAVHHAIVRVCASSGTSLKLPMLL